jgi:AcrR family transcriptional regulator
VTARDDIIASTVEELRNRDESSFRVTAVAIGAACATSVLYHYFGSRDGLLDAGYGALVDEEIAAHESYARVAFDVAERVHDAGEFVREVAADSSAPHRRISRRQRARLLGAAQTRLGVRSAFAAYGEQVAATNRAVVRRLQDRGLVRRDLDPASLALLLRLLEDAWITAEIDDPPSPSKDNWLDLVRIVGAALSPEGYFLDKAD